MRHFLSLKILKIGMQKLGPCFAWHPSPSVMPLPPKRYQQISPNPRFLYVYTLQYSCDVPYLIVHIIRSGGRTYEHFYLFCNFDPF